MHFESKEDQEVSELEKIETEDGGSNYRTL